MTPKLSLFIFVFMSWNVLAQDYDQLREELEAAEQELHSAISKLAEIHDKLSFLDPRANQTMDPKLITRSTDIYNPPHGIGQLSMFESAVPVSIRTKGVGEKRARLGVSLGSNMVDNELRVFVVEPGSGAEAAGIQPGDIIKGLDQVYLSDSREAMQELLTILKSVTPGDIVQANIERSGESLTIDVETDKQSLPASIGAFSIDSPLYNPFEAEVGLFIGGLGGNGYFNFVDVDSNLGSYFGVDSGVLVLQAPENSELQSGDILLECEGEAIGSAKDAYEKIHHRGLDGVNEVTVQRFGSVHTLNVDIPNRPIFEGLEIFKSENLDNQH